MPQDMAEEYESIIMCYLYFKRYPSFAGLFLWVLLSGQPAHARDVEDPYAIMERVRYAMASISDYTCIFSKHELVGDNVIREDNIILKVKRPGHFYMKWTEGPNKNRVAIYIEGQNNNNIKLHLNGLLGFLTVAIDPKGKKALEENRHAITEADIVSIFNRFAANCNMGRTDPECSTITAALTDPDTLVLKAGFPPGKGYYAHTAAMTVDIRSWVPVRITCYGWNDEFLEEYRFENIKINPGLTGKDFEKNW
jgi:hypothetical protein